MDNDREHDAEADDGTPSKAELARAKLKVVAHYATIAFAPVVSVVALTVGVIAVVNNQSQAERAQLAELAARVDSLNASLGGSRAELEALKFAVTRDKALHAEERKKLDEQDEMIVQSVTRLQIKLKMTPTLEMQLQQAASSPVAVSAVSAPAAVPAAAASGNKETVPAAVPKGVDKTPGQVKSLKEAIQKFNGK
ncbi:hypothetical protein MIZ01_0777 [Sideroxyarcus emersonii]|uniref:Uncharacterized protein n=1 Tax=Sideroxyarcus emersonii TaxID=2764705 RepID=A0AAN2BYR2_9PROT|nr:hypothetical protein [Sideroxyarcus emersonii]BCK87007.1 hypothetical protein MIZ01_0777 [Sideroxyarcus emersonii]